MAAIDTTLPAAPAPAGPRGRLPRWGRGLLVAATLFVALAALLAAAALWLLRSDGGTRWLLQRVPGLQVEDSRGALLDERFSARRISWTGGPLQLRLDDLAWQGARWRPLPDGGGWFSLALGELRIGRVEVRTGPPSETRPTPPATLRQPLQLDLQSVQVGELRIDALEPLHDLHAAVVLGGDRGARHRVELRRLRWQHVEAQGKAHIETDAPYRLAAQLQLRGGDSLRWAADAGIAGPLSSIDLKLRLSGAPGDQPAAGGPPQALDAQVQVRPFELWPLGDVNLSTRSLDLSALLPGAPRTRLTGHALIRSQGLREPVSADVVMDNASPGRLDEQALPVLALRLALKADPRQPERVVIGPFELDAADASGAAGRWSGGGLWDGGELTLQTRLAHLQPARLDGRLAAMRLSGPLDLAIQGLPSPAPQAGGQPAWAGAGSLTVQAKGRLEGSIGGAPQEVQLAFDIGGGARQLEIRSLLARSGQARAELSARLTRLPAQRWQLSSQGELDAFEPLTWFPGPQSAAWGRGPHRLSGRWNIDVGAPQAVTTLPLARAVPMLEGRVDLRIADSVLAGLPFAANVQLRQDPAADRLLRTQGRAELRLASALLNVDASGDPAGSGSTDRTQLRLQIPSLGELAPLAEQLPALQPWRPRRGEVQLRADLRGRWPDIGGDVQGRARGVEAGALGLGSAELEGRFDRSRGDELVLRADAAAIGWREMRLDTLRAQLRGKPAEHRFDVELAAPLQPPPALARALSWRQGPGARARLAGQGSWNSLPGGGGRWAGRLEQLGAGSQPVAGDAGADVSWLDARDLQGEWTVDAEGSIAQVLLRPGLARSGPLALRWDEFRWQPTPGGPSEWRLKGQLEPFAIAPLLQLAQQALPGTLRWSGDLRLGASLDVRAGARLDAEVRVQREGNGDLAFSDGGKPQPLGITDAALALDVRDGTWRFAPRIAGQMLGRLDGELVARTDPARRWPAPDAPISGQLQARIASLGALSGWLPPGWTLQGEVDAQARLSGTLGSPGYTGHLKGDRIGVRNLLAGVDLRDGAVRLRLDGETAQIESLGLRGGDGTLVADGTARFGAQPQLELHARADKLRVIGRVDRQLVLSGQASLAAAADRLRLDGRIVADSGFFDLSRRDAPGLDEDVSVARGDEPAPAEVTRREPSPAMRNAQVALDVDLGPRLHLRGRGLDTRLAGTLRISAPLGRFAVNGTVRAEDGTYAAYGQKLTIERGRVAFNGPVDGARLDILALRPNLDIRVGVAITGSALDPRVRLFSEPEMAETEKLSWLVLGRGSAGLGRTDTALLQRAALALLAGEGESPTDSVLRMLGLDEFSIRQSDGEVRETVVSVGKQLGRRWYVGYERGVNATAGTWQLIYRVAQRFTLRAQSGQDNSLDLIRTWRFGPPRRSDVPE